MTLMIDTTTIVRVISSPAVASLLAIHPNNVTLGGQELPSEWSTWWAWASDYTPSRPDQGPAWLQLIQYFTRPQGDDGRRTDIPSELCSLIDSVRSLQLRRTPSAYQSHGLASGRSHGLSPKKQHEVDRMSSYIHHLVHSERPRSVWHAVDVGSGQGYLSRALRELDFHVLALDNNEKQTSGADRWTRREAARKMKNGHHTDLGRLAKPAGDLSSHSRVESADQGNACGQIRCSDYSPGTFGARQRSLTHQTVHVCPRTLRESIANWLANPPGIRGCDDTYIHQSEVTCPESVPVMLVALHACGSLAVDVLRTFLTDRARVPQVKGLEHTWRSHSLVVVGCCYNLMFPSDFPLSKPLRVLDPVPKLPIAALHLAAQVPSQWLASESTLRAAELALRKVAYRALLQPLLQAAGAMPSVAKGPPTSPEPPIQPGLGETLENRRLGKLNDQAYQSWPAFLERATEKLGIDYAAINASLSDWFTHEAARLRMENALFVLQTLRCILGPLIETLILLDRQSWIQEELAEMNGRGREVKVEIVNLFDQATGSGRNVALVVRPATIPH